MNIEQHYFGPDIEAALAHQAWLEANGEDLDEAIARLYERRETTEETVQ